MVDFNAIVAFCSSEQTLRGGLIGGLFLAGVAGSVMHCAPMCGGFVLGQVADRIAAVPAARLCEWRRVGNALLVPYHLGRLTTYAALGAVAGRIVWLSPVFLVAAVALFGLVALRRVTWLDRTPRPWGRLIARVSQKLPRRSFLGTYLLGVTLGFLPCGFLYAALAASASSGSPATGASAMVAFGLGTVPALVVVGIAGQAAGRRFGRDVTLAAPFLLGLNAFTLLILALRHR